MQDAARCRLILLHLDADAPAGAAFAAASRCRFALCAVWICAVVKEVAVVRRLSPRLELRGPAAAPPRVRTATSRHTRRRHRGRRRGAGARRDGGRLELEHPRDAWPVCRRRQEGADPELRRRRARCADHPGLQPWTERTGAHSARPHLTCGRRGGTDERTASFLKGRGTPHYLRKLRSASGSTDNHATSGACQGQGPSLDRAVFGPSPASAARQLGFVLWPPAPPWNAQASSSRSCTSFSRWG